MKTTKLIPMYSTSTLLLYLLFYSYASYSQVTVNGFAYLQNQTFHDSIKILFIRTTPSALSDSTFTNSIGAYNKTIPTGVYNIYYTKQNYFNNQALNVSISSSQTLSSVTLNQHTTILNVPTNYSSIQDAINNAIENDTVLVQPGIYYENITLNKNITLASNFIFSLDTSVITSTIIDGNQTSNGITITNHCPRIIGLTVTNAKGRGIKSTGSSPYLKNMIISSNNGINSGGGGGMFFDYGSPVIENTVIKNNTACYGGAFYTTGANVTLRNVIISNNVASNTCMAGNGGIGGAIYLGNGGHSTFQNVVFDNNSCQVNGSVIYTNYVSNFTLTNSIISNNSGNYAIYNTSGSTATISYSDFWNNSTNLFYGCNSWLGVNQIVNANGDSCDYFNNIKLDPLFTSTNTSLYILQSNSPCKNVGINDSVKLSFDFTNKQRIWNNVVDMGANEYGAPTDSVFFQSIQEISTLPVSSISNTSANSGGMIINGFGSSITARGICFSTSPTPTISNSVVTSGNGIGSYTCTMSGLIPNTTYFIRAFATTCYGTFYANEYSFTTLNNVGILEHANEKRLDIYPNPFSTLLTFKLADSEPTSISLYDFLGQQIMRLSFTNSTTINTEQLADGIYIMQIGDKQGNIIDTRKIIKQ